MAYQYIDPTLSGYRRVKLSKADHRRLLPNHPLKWHKRFEYYICDTDLLVHCFVSPPAIVLNTLLFPIALLLYGVANFKEVWRDHAKTLRQKHYGSFTSDKVWARCEAFDDFLRAVKP